MRWAEDSGISTSVHSWKPCPADRFAKLVHGYATICGSKHGHAGLSMTAAKLDHESTATIYYRPKQYPDHHGISTPVLMTVSVSDGRVLTFERIPSRDYPGLPIVTGLPTPTGRRSDQDDAPKLTEEWSEGAVAVPAQRGAMPPADGD